MRRNKRRLPVPQHEFGFTPATFNLMQENTLDGERIAHERAEAEHARQLAEAAQAAFFTSNKATMKNPYRRRPHGSGNC